MLECQHSGGGASMRDGGLHHPVWSSSMGRSSEDEKIQGNTNMYSVEMRFAIVSAYRTISAVAA